MPVMNSPSPAAPLNRAALAALDATDPLADFRTEFDLPEDVIYLDRQYIEQWSFWLDVNILFRTVPAVLRRTGAF